MIGIFNCNICGKSSEDGHSHTFTVQSASTLPPPQAHTPDWTIDPKTGRTNSSKKFLELVTEVQRLIRSEAFQLISGNHEPTARLIMAQLAHVHKLSPSEATSAPQEARALKQIYNITVKLIQDDMPREVLEGAINRIHEWAERGVPLEETENET